MRALKREHEKTLRAILWKYFRNTTTSVFVFGSRTGQSYRPDSDIDLLIDTQDEIPLSTMAMLKEAFEESDLPFRVDVVLRTDINPKFYQRIQEDLTPICAFSGSAKAARRNT